MYAIRSYYAHYAADVTRTFPVSGTFSRSQQALYEVVLHANRQAIDRCRPGVNFIEPHATARITSYNVCYTKLLRIRRLRGDLDRGGARLELSETLPGLRLVGLGSDLQISFP